MFDAIIVAEPVIAGYFPRSKTFLVRNFPEVNSFRERRDTPYTTRPARMTYVGALTRPRGLYEMLDGAREASAVAEFEFVLGGKFSPPDLQAHVLANYRVNFLSWVSYSQLVDLLFDSKVGIIIPQPNKRYTTNYPVKMFEFMAAGLPVIGSRDGESAAFITECDGGILVNPRDVSETARAIVWLFGHPHQAEAMGRRGQELIFTKYNWENESQVLLNLYKNLS